MIHGGLHGLHGPGWLWLGGKRSRDYLPVFATLNAQSTHHGARPRPKLAPTTGEQINSNQDQIWLGKIVVFVHIVGPDYYGLP